MRSRFCDVLFGWIDEKPGKTVAREVVVVVAGTVLICGMCVGVAVVTIVVSPVIWLTVTALSAAVFTVWAVT